MMFGLAEAIAGADLGFNVIPPKGSLQDYKLWDPPSGIGREQICITRGSSGSDNHLREVGKDVGNFYTNGQLHGKILQSLTITLRDESKARAPKALNEEVLARLGDQWELNGRFITQRETLNILNRCGFHVCPRSVLTRQDSIHLLNAWHTSLTAERKDEQVEQIEQIADRMIGAFREEMQQLKQPLQQLKQPLQLQLKQPLLNANTGQRASEAKRCCGCILS